MQAALNNIKTIVQSDDIAAISGWFSCTSIHYDLISERSNKQEGREVAVRCAAATVAGESSEDKMDTEQDTEAGQNTLLRRDTLENNNGASHVILQ